MSVLSKYLSLMTTVNNQSPTNLGNSSLHTYLRQPPMAALKIKSRNGEVSLQIQLKKLRLHSAGLCYPQKTCATQLLLIKTIQH